MDNPPPVQTAKSSTGLEENIAALLTYVAGWISGLIFFLIEKDSRLVKFHGMQSILLNATAIVIGIVLWVAYVVFAIIFSMISDVLAWLSSILFGLVMFVFYVGILIGWVMCLIKAYQSQYFKLPVLGNLAEKFSAK